MGSIIISFFVELFQRIKTKSPTFFRVLQLLGASLTFAGYIPSMLQRWFNVEVPGHVISMCEDVAKYAAGFFAAALFPVAAQPIAVNGDGEVLKKTDEKKLPFTAKKEEKAALKNGGILNPETETSTDIIKTIDDGK